MEIKQEEQFWGILGWISEIIFKICLKLDNQPLTISECEHNKSGNFRESNWITLHKVHQSIWEWKIRESE